MSFYVNGCQRVYNVYLVYVPCPIRDPHHTGQNHWALRSREQRRTTSLRSVSKGEWKVLELCTFCLLQIRRTYANGPGVPRTATAGAEKETMSLSGKRQHRTFDSLSSKLKKHILRPIKVVQTTSL